MRGVLILTALGLLGASSAIAAPVNGAVIGATAATESTVQRAQFRTQRRCVAWRVVYRHLPATSRRVQQHACVRWLHR